MTIERRSVAEVRTAGRSLEGLAVPYGVPTKLGDITEIIAVDAMEWRGRDVLALVDHDPAKLLARTKNDSLRLAQTAGGVRFTLDLPDTTLGKDMLEMARRGLLGGVSVGFIAHDNRWQGNRREVRAASLVEVSIVCAHPAYPTTSVALRSLRRRWLETLI